MLKRTVKPAEERYGRLVILKFIESYRSESGQTKRRVLCRCDCGKEKEIRYSHLRQGKTLSCGCLQKERQLESHKTHGMSRTAKYSRWNNIMGRCYDPNNPKYPRYGGRGIKVCERWHDVTKFYADMGEPPLGSSIDRIDNDGDYCPKNCRWATPKIQANNQSDNRRLTYNGKTLTIAQWAEETGINHQTIYGRVVTMGWSVEKALTEPVDPLRSNKTYDLSVTFNGETKLVSQWAKEINMPYKTLFNRLYCMKWPVEKALITPLRKITSVPKKLKNK